MKKPEQLIFIYNADSGMFNTMTDIAHKIFSPQTYACDLCMITHGAFHERKEWRTFIESLPVETEFLHRDEFKKRYPDSTLQLPVIASMQSGQLVEWVSAQELRLCESVDALVALISQRLVDDR